MPAGARGRRRRSLSAAALRDRAVRSAIEQLAAIDAGGALASRIAALQADRRAGRLATARLTLDPSERHGFEYQSWFGFTIYAEGVRGALGRGGTYRILAVQTARARTGNRLLALSRSADRRCDGSETRRDTLFLPLGHDPGRRGRLRGEGWRTVAALSDGDDAKALGCSHVLDGEDAKPLA